MNGKLNLLNMGARKRLRVDNPVAKTFYEELFEKGLTLREIANRIEVSERSILMRIYQEGLKHRNIKELETTRKIIEGLSREGFRRTVALLRELAEEWKMIYEENRRASYEKHKERVREWKRRRKS